MYPGPTIDRRSTLKTLGLGWLAWRYPSTLLAALTPEPPSKAMEISRFLQQTYWDEKEDLYNDKPDKKGPTAVWGAGVMFSSLVAGARQDKRFLIFVNRYFKGLDRYWDSKAKVPGYEPVPTGGNGHDKYYDDNAWMVLTFLEAYELTGAQKFLLRAKETLEFVLSGWDEQLGGGLWWHEQHKGDCKNTCVNAPAALGCFKLSKFSDPKNAARLIEKGQKIVDWTVKTLQAPNGLFKDSIKVTTGEVNGAQLTYNTALMLRCFLWLHSYSGKPEHLAEALRIAKAADGLLDGRTGAYRDSPKWSHLMVEADIATYRHTRQQHFLDRAKKSCEVHYAAWKAAPPVSIIDNASYARELWLLSDLDNAAALQFWDRSDRARK